MKKEYTIRKMSLSVLLGTLIVVCLCGCGKDTAYYIDAESLQTEDTQDGDLGTNQTGEIATAEDKTAETDSTKASEQLETDMLCVYVCGAVSKPGVYQLSEGSRIVDLFLIAGGLTKTAALEYWNQAQLLEDGQMYYVPTVEETKAQGSTTSLTDNDADATTSDGKININTASKEQLMTIPGIGEAKAQAILSYRQANGDFASIEDIMQVEGIKDGVFEKIKNYIKIN